MCMHVLYVQVGFFVCTDGLQNAQHKLKRCAILGERRLSEKRQERDWWVRIVQKGTDWKCIQ